MSTYLAETARNRLEMAQTMIDEHLMTDAGGRCIQCGEQEPCTARQAAVSTFILYRKLPRRTPGTATPWFDRKGS